MPVQFYTISELNTMTPSVIKSKLEETGRIEFDFNESYEEVRFDGGSIYDSGDYTEDFYELMPNVQYAIKKVIKYLKE